MTDSLQKIIERILLVIVCLVGPALFFQMYKSIQKETLAEESARDFLERVTSSGKIDDMEYMMFRDGLALLDGFDSDLNYTTYHNEPVYAMYSAAEIANFFKERNKRDLHYYHAPAPAVEDVDPLTLRMQTKTNATVLATLMDSGLPIRDDVVVGTASCTAVEPMQELYAGEIVASVIKVDTGSIVYYAEGDTIYATGSGIKTFNITRGGVSTGAVVTARVWPRQVNCPVCHNNYSCTKEVVEHYRATNTWDFCPHCASLVKNITVDVSAATIPIGTPEADILDFTFTIHYYNGRTEEASLVDLSHNYSPNYGGVQQISASYKGYDAVNICTITTQCPECVNCHTRIVERNAFDCSLYVLCPICQSLQPTFLGECVISPETFSGDYIANELITNGKFSMGRDDYLKLIVDHRGQRAAGKFYFISSDKDIFFRMGKRVRRTGVD